MAGAVGCGLLLGSGCGVRPPDPTGVTVVIDGGPSSLDPRRGSDEASRRVCDLLFNSLFRTGDDGGVVPDLALSAGQRDDRTLEVILRAGVRFHDGRPLTSDDVAETYRSVLAGRVASFRRADLEAIDTIETPDARTLVFHMSRPFAPLVSNLTLPILPARGSDDPEHHPIGSGPFRLVRYRKDEDLLLEAFDGYFEGRSRLSSVRLRILPSETSRLLEMLHGSGDLVVNDLAPEQFARLEGTPGFEVASRPGRNVVYLIFNLSHPALRDVRVRRAVAQALDRGAIVRHLLLGKATLATGLLPPGHWAYDAEARRFDHDPAAAQRLLDEAGYPDPGGGRPRLRLRYAASQGEISLQQAAVIQEDLARIGIAVEVRASEWATFYDDLRSGRFEMAVSNWTDIGDPDIFRLRFASSETPPAGLNRGGYANPRADRFIEAGARETDRDRRRADYAGLQVLLAEDLPCVWLWHKDVRAASGPRLRGFTLTSGADFRPLWRARVATTSASGEAASEGRLEGGGGDGARADEMRRVPGQVDDRGGAPPAGRSGVDDQIDAVAETLFHLAGGARRWCAAAVGAGGDDRRPEGARQSGGDGMGRHAHADGTPAAEEPRRQVGRGLEDERQRSGPEGFHQAAGALRDDRERCDGGGIGGEQRQRQAIGPSLGRVDRLDRGGRPRVARQTVEGFGGIRHQAAGAQHLGGAGENLRRGSLGIDPHRLRHRAVPPHAPCTEAGATIAQGVAA
jgi:peptide/nickel transport system substrate-binding protein